MTENQESLNDYKLKALVELETAKAIHNMKMEELAYERETNKLYHDWALERERIKRAETRKEYQERKSLEGYRR